MDAEACFRLLFRSFRRGGSGFIRHMAEARILLLRRLCGPSRGTMLYDIMRCIYRIFLRKLLNGRGLTRTFALIRLRETPE